MSPIDLGRDLHSKDPNTKPDLPIFEKELRKSGLARISTIPQCSDSMNCSVDPRAGYIGVY